MDEESIVKDAHEGHVRAMIRETPLQSIPLTVVIAGSSICCRYDKMNRKRGGGSLPVFVVMIPTLPPSPYTPMPRCNENCHNGFSSRQLPGLPTYNDSDTARKFRKTFLATSNRQLSHRPR